MYTRRLGGKFGRLSGTLLVLALLLSPFTEVRLTEAQEPALKSFEETLPGKKPPRLEERFQPPAKKKKKEELRFLRDPSASAALSADELQEDRERKRVIARGFADLRYLGNRVQADYIEVQTETRDAVATGNIVFQTGNDRIVGSRVEFNLDNERVVIHDARGYIAATYYITGQVLRRTSEDRYEIINGTFTTCKGEIQAWSFATKKANFQIEGIATLQTPAIKVLGIPVAALPFAVVPIKTKRSSGFLAPEIGFGGRNGFQISPEFFWAINDWSDATVGFDYLEKRGIRYKGEYRYKLSKRTAGFFRGRFLQDKRTRIGLWDIKTAHATTFPDNSIFSAFLDFEKADPTDRSLERDIITRVRQNSDTRIDYIKNFRSIPGQFRIGLRRQEGLREREDQLFQRFPDIELKINNAQILDTDFRYSQDASFVSFIRVENSNTTNLYRVHFAPSVSLPLRLPWLGVTPKLGFFETYWSDRKIDSTAPNNPSRDQMKDDGLSRELWEAAINIEGPRLSKVYEADLGPLKDLKHIIAFKANYSYIPAQDSRDRRLIIPVDTIDALQDRNIVTYGVTNRFLTKIRKGDGFQTRQLFRVDVTNSFDFAEDRRKQNPNIEKRPFGDVVVTAFARPISFLRFTHQTRFNPYEGQIDEHSTGLLLDGGKNWFFNIDRTWKRQRNSFPRSTGESFINLSGGLALTREVFVEYLTRLNNVEKATLEQSLILRYRGCCWGFALTFTDTRDRSEVFLTFTLNGILEGKKAPTFKSRRKVGEEGRFLSSRALGPFHFPEPTPPETTAP